MANPWFRLWTDMVNDPKWRTISRVSKQEISRVIAVALHMMTCASNATNRGHTEGWNDEDVATALDIETSDVTAIREAMQGRVLDGDYLTGWEKRQPKREREDDNGTERSRQSRQRQKEQKETMQRHATPCNTNENQATPREEESREEKEEKPKTKKAPPAALPVSVLVDLGVPEQVAIDWYAIRAKKRLPLTQTALDGVIADVAKAGMTIEEAIRLCCKRGWAGFEADWVNKPQARGSPVERPEKFDPTAYVNRPRMQPNERTIELDESGEPI